MALKLFLCGLLLCTLQTADADVHPVERVIGLLEGLIDKTETEGKQEEVTYSKFEYWCKNSVKTLEGAIADEREAIDSLTSRVQSKTEEVALLTEQIDALDAELLNIQTADTAAANVRGSQAAVYTQAESDYTSTISAISDAITALEAAQTSTDGLLLAQRKVEQVLVLSEGAATNEQHGLLAAFVQQANASDTPRPELRAGGDYGAHVKKYAFKSNSVIEMLKELKLKFEDEKNAATRGETASLNAYELARAARQDLTNKATNSKTAKNTARGDARTALNEAEGSLNSTRDDLQADSATLTQTENACTVKKSEWARRSETRARELEAMKMAIKIMAKVTGVRTEAPTNPVPPPSPVSFLAVTTDPKLQAVQLLRASAHASNSRALDRLAQEISAHLSGPFDAVNNMIQKMIFHLMDEQKDEDKHKNWCDLELNKTEISKTDKVDRMADLKAKLDDAKATVLTLSGEITKADQMVETITSHMEEATAVREEGKVENKEALKDARDAQSAISNAIAVLEAFYKDSGMVPKESWELLQRGVTLPTAPDTWDSSYTGTTDPKEQPDGIITVLKRVSADFASMEAQTLAQEESDQNLYEEDMKLNEIEKARRSKESEVKTQEKKRLVEKIASMTASRKHVSDEKEAVEQYLRDLQHACVDGDSTYENRTAARTGEIEALKQAQTILATAFEGNGTNSSTGGTPSFLQRRFLRH